VNGDSTGLRPRGGCECWVWGGRGVSREINSVIRHRTELISPIPLKWRDPSERPSKALASGAVSTKNRYFLNSKL
jgi:hypothetical protein